MTPVVMIAGDGIGPEVMAATRKVLQAAGARVDWIVTFTAAAYNLIRLRTLLARPA